MVKNQTNKKLTPCEIFAINLRGLMAMKGIKAEEMQEYMQISPATFYKRLRRPYEFTLGDMDSAAKKLNVNASDMIHKVMEVSASG